MREPNLIWRIYAVNPSPYMAVRSFNSLHGKKAYEFGQLAQEQLSRPRNVDGTPHSRSRWVAVSDIYSGAGAAKGALACLLPLGLFTRLRQENADEFHQ